MQALNFLVFDYGIKRMGVAAGQTVTGTARPLNPMAMQNGHPDWNAIEVLLGEWKPAGVIVGLPLNMDGSASDMTRRADKFRKRLHGRFALPALAWDERLTSDAIKRIERARGVTDFGQHSVDSQAAALIFQSWFDSLDNLADWPMHSIALPPQ
ncbi:MAG: Holliday junction resolvase RuvX [Natronospirillum sp.]